MSLRGARFEQLLRETLDLWRVPGDVESRGEAIVIRVGEAQIAVERATEGPFRWSVTTDGRKRPCTSVLGVLNALRRALDVDRGAPLRIA